MFLQTILFTTDEGILEEVSKNDDAYEGDWLSDDEPDDVPFERPSTADEGEDDASPLNDTFILALSYLDIVIYICLLNCLQLS